MADFIKIEGLERLQAKIERLQSLKTKRMMAAVMVAALHIAGFMKRYPAPARRAQPFKTDKQRRYFFYALAHGLIQVPYRRGQSPGSRNLKQMWSIKQYGLRAEVGNSTAYGPLVQDRVTQAAYHRATGWQTQQDAVEQEGPRAVQYIREAVREEVEE